MPRHHSLPPTGTASFFWLPDDGCWLLVVGYWLLVMASSEILQPKKDRVDGGKMVSKNAKAIRFKRRKVLNFSVIHSLHNAV